MNIESLAKQLNIKDLRVIGKAQELLRMSTVRVTGSLGQVRRTAGIIFEHNKSIVSDPVHGGVAQLHRWLHIVSAPFDCIHC